MIMISPNPFSDFVIVDLAAHDDFPVDFLVFVGEKEVFRNRIFTSKKIVDVSELKSGTYRVCMQAEKGIVYEGYCSKL